MEGRMVLALNPNPSTEVPNSNCSTEGSSIEGTSIRRLQMWNTYSGEGDFCNGVIESEAIMDYPSVLERSVLTNVELLDFGFCC